MSVRSVKVSNVSLGAYEQDIKEFFIFSGDIAYVEMHGDNDRSQVAYITFKEPQGAETAVLLTGATIVDQLVTIELAPDYKLPANVFIPSATDGDGYKKAEDVVSSMLARGFIISKDAVNKAKAFDDKHKFTTTASDKIASLDQKIGFTEKVNAGTTMVNEKMREVDQKFQVSEKMREVDQKFQVSEKTKSAYAAAEQSVSNARSAIMKNPYVSAGALWVSAAYNRVAKAAEDVGQKTREKVLAEEQAQKPEGHAYINESKSPKAAKPEASEQPSDPSTERSFVLGENASDPLTEQSFVLGENASDPLTEQSFVLGENALNPSSEEGLILSEQPSNPSSEQKMIL